jgi:uncharacterized protein (TIGR00290 family)
VKRILLAWSSGKDCAWTLHVLRQRKGIEVAGLFTTFTENADRVTMHEVRRALVEQQAAAAGLPLWPVSLPWPCPNTAYEARIAALARRACEHGISQIAFGDLFLEDIRDYRIRQFAHSGLDPIFPIWQQPTATLARRMIDAGLEAIVTCVDAGKLPPTCAGRTFDHAFLDDLPPTTDPCGENGEFHTFTTAGPMFETRLNVTVGATPTRDGFHFADLQPA